MELNDIIDISEYAVYESINGVEHLVGCCSDLNAALTLYNYIFMARDIHKNSSYTIRLFDFAKNTDIESYDSESDMC